MSKAKEIRDKIKSIQNTKKITKAMEMVAASKMKKVQDSMGRSRPYSEKIKDVIKNVGEGVLEYKHPFVTARDEKNVGVIMVSTDKGLCGGLNVNLFKHFMKNILEFKTKNVGIKAVIIGKKAELFAKRVGLTVVGSVTNLGDNPQVSDLLGIIKIMSDLYLNKEVDSVYLLYNRFKNTMSQIPIYEKIIPIQTKVFSGAESKKRLWDYLYEPEPEKLFELLMKRYIESLVYQSVVENIACEQAARMVAMKSATDNAGELINAFKLMYNKARQASITQELSEIVAGAEAV
ncbi:F0F1 ATP synthase subunit gamma [Candidatus Azoamicus ciliaticola]|uniref:ATP synthase gamma chain n=1 Tax=Candidatus Azoamicus ciliaticola TaxID=2652803 RepID=A0A6J5JXB3_9GAMM|nr:F0F1 ATP synthase subunit gamma [Candidatus Azoamicus ciliaticola]CAB3976271.1 ATP synthase gamma chain [Candidatus Azoamicus ciliaticola]